MEWNIEWIQVKPSISNNAGLLKGLNGFRVVVVGAGVGERHEGWFAEEIIVPSAHFASSTYNPLLLSAKSHPKLA